MRRSLLLAMLVVGTVVVLAAPAWACGGLVGENGTIQLVRTTTLAAYRDGIEHYITSFEFTGTGEGVGSLVPLPGVPTKVEKAGEWTLQRLQLEVQPPLRTALATAEGDVAAASSAEVLLEAEVDALDITVLRGGAEAVGKWALDNGFLLTPDAPEVLDFYARRSPIFMAARFNVGRAQTRGLAQGQATPIQLTIPIDRPWVPLRILGLGLPAGQEVAADVFLLTDEQPRLRLGPGLSEERSEPASASLLDDLRRDDRMDWVPGAAWLSYLQLRTDAGSLDYDLAVSTDRRADADRPQLPVEEGSSRGRLAAFIGGGVVVLRAARAAHLRLR